MDDSALDQIKEIKIDPPAQNQKPAGRFNRRKLLKIAGLILGVFLLILVVLGGVIGVPAYRTYKDAVVFYQSAKDTYQSAKAQDIAQTESKLGNTQEKLAVVRKDYAALAWTKAIPFAGAYSADAEHFINAGTYGLEAAQVIVESVKPYADILGLKGQGTFAGGTTEDRITKAVETLDKVTPQIDTVAAKMALVQKEIDAVDPNRYPVSFRGREIRGQITNLKDTLDISGQFLTQARPLVKKLPDLLGASTERKYLILFQNDAELRPTGGFITAYAVFRVEKGKIHIDSSDDIYKLDDTITKHVTPPEPISKYLNVYSWRLRDANFSPDYPSSMKTFMDLYNSSTDKKKIDGIITMDTHVLLKILQVLGPISVYNTNFTTANVPQCACPMVIYELEKYADEPKSYARGSRKDIIGVLLSAMMQKALQAPKQLGEPLFQTAISELQTKHILVYLLDQEAEQGVLAVNFGGAIKDYPGDFLHINDANLGGAKSNMYIKQTATVDTKVTANGTETNLTIEYRHTHPADNCSLERKEGLCLSGIYRDYLRVYLPAGASVSEVRGFENTPTTYKDLGKTAVSGFFTVVPLGLARIQIKYTTPVKFNGWYSLLIQKQPGTNQNHYKLTVNGQKQEFDLTSDREIRVKL